MKTRIIKSLIIIFTGSLLLVNIDLITDGKSVLSSFIREAYAIEDPTRPNTNYLPFNYLKQKWCIIADVEFEINFFGASIIPNISGNIDFNGSRWKCEPVQQNIYCYIYDQKPCSPVSD